MIEHQPCLKDSTLGFKMDRTVDEDLERLAVSTWATAGTSMRSLTPGTRTCSPMDASPSAS